MTFPPDFTFAKDKTVTAHVAAHMIACLVPERRAVVQAGGCAGLWPLALAHYFDYVYTFEPAPQNFAYLEANIQATPNVSAFPCALGDARRFVSLTRPKAKAGLWRVDGVGAIPMVPLDDVVGDIPVDALVLDIEGSEVQALQGAAQCIERNRPALWLERLHDAAAIDAILAAHGYPPLTPGVGGDGYSVHPSRTH